MQETNESIRKISNTKSITDDEYYSYRKRVKFMDDIIILFPASQVQHAIQFSDYIIRKKGKPYHLSVPKILVAILLKTSTKAFRCW